MVLTAFDVSYPSIGYRCNGRSVTYFNKSYLSIPTIMLASAV